MTGPADRLRQLAEGAEPAPWETRGVQVRNEDGTSLLVCYLQEHDASFVVAARNLWGAIADTIEAAETLAGVVVCPDEDCADDACVHGRMVNESVAVLRGLLDGETR